MKKAELESERTQYHAHMERAKAAEALGFLRPAINEAVAAWPFIDSMMQYEQKFEDKEFKSIGAIDIVLKYAPHFLDLDILKKLEDFLSQNKRIAKNTSQDEAAEIASAREKIHQYHRLWSYFETNPGCLITDVYEKLGRNQPYWQAIIASWQKMALIRLVSDDLTSRISLVTRMTETVRGKCPRCGTVIQATKSSLLGPVDCQKCNKPMSFVLKP